MTSAGLSTPELRLQLNALAAPILVSALGKTQDTKTPAQTISLLISSDIVSYFISIYFIAVPNVPMYALAPRAKRCKLRSLQAHVPGCACGAYVVLIDKAVTREMDTGPAC